MLSIDYPLWWFAGLLSSPRPTLVDPLSHAKLASSPFSQHRLSHCGFTLPTSSQGGVDVGQRKSKSDSLFARE